MQQTAFLNKKGVTLVEVMISLVILLVVFMGLIQASLLSINSNMRNEVRDIAASLAAEYMSRAKATPVGDLMGRYPVCNPPAMTSWALMTPTPTILRQVRGVQQLYTVNACLTGATPNSAVVTVTVTFTVPGETTPNTQTMSAVVRN